MVRIGAAGIPRVFFIRQATEPELEVLLEAWHSAYMVFGPYPIEQQSVRDLSVKLPYEETSRHFKKFDLVFRGPGGEDQARFAYAPSWEHLRVFCAEVLGVELFDQKDMPK